MPTPQYLYHAAPLKVFLLIKAGGLKALSKGGRAGTYLCASDQEGGATTLERRANDVIFRIDTTGDDGWYEEGAGKNEWRKDSAVAPGSLKCRRFQKKAPNRQNTAYDTIDDYVTKYGIKAFKDKVLETK
jgi:hypothetical protein